MQAVVQQPDSERKRGDFIPLAFAVHGTAHGVFRWPSAEHGVVAAELVSNQVKHARSRGMLQIWQQPGPALDLVALDFGPGIPNLVLAQQDGYSTANTLGKD